MTTELQFFMSESKKKIEAKLPELIDSLLAPESLKKSMIYSLEAGGKRIRPVLLLSVLKGFNQPVEKGLEMACAIEMIHTYSLIHDDLPAMDDDDVRRGKPTNHKVFGEAQAILAGDALLTYSYQLVSTISEEPSKVVSLMTELSRAAGAEGMVGGQVSDMEGENKDLSVEELEQIHHHKTGDLMVVSLVAGAILAGASERDQANLRHFGRELGLLFQIKDDILDIEGDAETIGKPVGSDAGNNKGTYPSILGMDGAKQRLEHHLALALSSLKEVDMDQSLLIELTKYVAYRNH
ncbi:polyprenyl synthetase family protein [Alkalicoccobacillus murimartini]|uniref:Geranylgeranyl diphosphate synthase type II n=1 Tax=Alkalicoccobacillus murimartini TaxID=171685 RepID=A0ABT9YM53_9BACI|nr:farnesyl diphosphate synthase [Alkalicoccobacillus murimartini]MDQ0208957.1 geranylgeranyl diphosphate synthase type II [Alkalicoccobacillus murimartini]